MFRIISDGSIENEDEVMYDEPAAVEFQLIRGNQIFEDVEIELTESNLKVISPDTETTKKLAKYSIFEFPENLILELPWGKISDFTLNIEIYDTPSNQRSLFAKEESVEEPNLFFEIIPDLSNWKRRYSFVEYKNEFLTNLMLRDKSNYRIQSYDNKITVFSSIDFSIKHDFLNKSNIRQSIEDEFEQYVLFCNKIHEITSTNLEKQVFEGSMATSFNFPEELKIPCKQYLEYFARFLEDLGINATSNLKEEAGKVLFSVTPTDDVEALDKIREALALYLHLPESPIIYNESFAAMRLKKEIDSLHYAQSMMENELRSAQYTLRLAQQTVEHQDKIIQQKDSIIEQQNRVIEKVTSKSIMMDSVEKKEEFEKIFDGLEVGESKELKEKLGIKFNPATSLKTLGKKIIGRDDDIISLDLNKNE